MLFPDSHPMSNLPRIAWPGGRPKDAPDPNTNDQIRALLEKHQVTLRPGHNCYEVVNKNGDAIELPYSVGMSEWADAIEQVAEYAAK